MNAKLSKIVLKKKPLGITIFLRPSLIADTNIRSKSGIIKRYFICGGIFGIFGSNFM